MQRSIRRVGEPTNPDCLPSSSSCWAPWDWGNIPVKKMDKRKCGLMDK